MKFHNSWRKLITLLRLLGINRLKNKACPRNSNLKIGNEIIKDPEIISEELNTLFLSVEKVYGNRQKRLILHQLKIIQSFNVLITTVTENEVYIVIR